MLLCVVATLRSTSQELEELRRRVVKLASENERLEMITQLTGQTLDKMSGLCDIYKALCEPYKAKISRLDAAGKDE